MRAQVIVLLGVCLAAAPAVAQKKNSSKAKAAAAAPSFEMVQKRVALLEPPPAKGVPKTAAKWAVVFAGQEIKAQGFEVLDAKAIAKAFAKAKKKAPSCGDEAACLAEIAKITGAGYLANVTVRPAGKQLGVKLTLVDADDAKVVSNIFSLVFDSNPKTLRAAIQKQTPRAIAALKQHIDAKAGQRQPPAQAKPADPAAADLVALAPKPADGQPEIAPLSPKPADGQPEIATLSPKPSDAKPEAGASSTRPAETAALAPAGTQPPADPAAGAAVAPGDAPRTATVTAAPVTSGPVAAVQERSSGPGVLPYALIGVGAVATGVGIGLFGLQANDSVVDYQAGRDPAAARDAAKSKALLTDVTAGAGVALMLAGGALLMFSGDDEPASGSLTVTPTASTTSLGAAVSGSF